MAGFEISCVYCSPPDNRLMSFMPAVGQDEEAFGQGQNGGAGGAGGAGSAGIVVTQKAA